MSTTSASPTAPRSAASHSNPTSDTGRHAAIETPYAGMPALKSAPAGCPQCGDKAPWGGSAWCPKCGYYPKLGISISTDVLRPALEEEKLEAAEIPTWVWVAGGGIVLVLAVSLFARFYVPVDGPLTIWSLATLGLGVLLFGVSHVQAYLVGGAGSDKLGLMDLFLGPAAVWRAAMKHMPDTQWLACRGTWGVTLMLCGLLVVGGLGWDELNQLVASKAKTQEKFNPLQSMVGMARNGKGQPQNPGGPESLDEAMQAFVGDVGADQFQGAGQVAAEAPGLKKQCAIVGYTKSVNGELRSVLLASMTAGQLEEFVAKVPADRIPPALVSRLEAMLPELRTARPSVDCPMQAYWVKPDLSCFISYDAGEEGAEPDWSESQFLELLDKSGASVDLQQTQAVLEETQGELERSLPQLQDALSR
jgi:hypothetical protein